MEILIINIRRSGRTTILFDDDSYIGKTASFMETPCW